METWKHGNMETRQHGNGAQGVSAQTIEKNSAVMPYKSIAFKGSHLLDPTRLLAITE